MKAESPHSFRIFKLLTLCGFTAALVAFLTMPAREAAFLPIPVAAIVINFVISGWIVVFNKAFHLRSLKGYYRVLPSEKSIYERIGIRQFKRLVNSPYYGSIWGPSLRRQPGGGRDLRRLESEMRAAETAHLFGFIVAFGLFVYTVYRGWAHMAVWLFVLNIFLNAYPVMLQRYNRLRIYRIQPFDGEGESDRGSAP